MNALLAVLARILARLMELVTDAEDGRLNGKKIGELIVGFTWTVYMWRQQPEGVEMWLAYAGTILGWSTYQLRMKRTAIKERAGNAQ